ncbi:MAG: CDP-diacylglycerol--glycerol-3-phosphate 3-phosphatidyltransferase [Gammaproteobacteria bacterium]|nr:CDP-diacylglycerol--glycerol-3-phosphate 3-phosphatidyltransferase [Gammaproteobacteria bacterium]
MNAKHIPNLITLLRILLVPVVVWQIVYGQAWLALSLFLFAAISDGVDGYLARRYGWRTRLGSILDPLADKLLMVSIFITLGWLLVVPFWFVLLVLVRDVVIIVGGIAYHMLVGKYSMAPSLISKINTTVQMLLVSVLMVAPLWGMPDTLIQGLFYVAALTTVLSGINYVWVWGCRAAHHDRHMGASS